MQPNQSGGRRQPPHRPTAQARQEARERWQEQLSKHPGVLDFAFQEPVDGAPVERPEALTNVADAAPVDITMTWESMEHADTLFCNTELFCDLNGPLAGAPAVDVRDPSVSTP